MYGKIFEKYNLDDAKLTIEELVQNIPTVSIHRSQILDGFKIARTKKAGHRNLIKYWRSFRFTHFLTISSSEQDKKIDGDRLPEEDWMRLLDWLDAQSYRQQSPKILELLEKFCESEFGLNIVPVRELGPLYYHFLKDWWNLDLRVRYSYQADVPIEVSF